MDAGVPLKMQLYLVSDSISGLDQEYAIPVIFEAQSSSDSSSSGDNSSDSDSDSEQDGNNVDSSDNSWILLHYYIVQNN